MTDEAQTGLSRDEKVNRIIAAYLKAVDAGKTPDRAALLARHPELAAELVAFFTNHDALAPLPPGPGAAPAVADAPTLGPEEAPAGPAPGVRVGYFGDYELLGELGRGGMGVVYKARQVSLNRTVALKMILTGQLAHEEDVRRFHAEAEAAAKLDHPGIVPVFEVGQYEGHHYFSMAFVEGESLAHKLTRGLFPPRATAELVRKVAEAVAFAHVEGVVHRDLKPANILIDKNGQPRLTDFGLAKRVQGGSDLTATGQILGTPSYMPPEQASGRRGEVGPLSDVYSLGAVLYCLLTGRPPFQAATPLDTILQVLEREPVPPRQLNAAVPRDLETICLKCLAKEPNRRYASARELAADLERFLNGQPIQARSVGSAERLWRWGRRNPVVASLGASVALCLLAGSSVATLLAIQAAHAQMRADAEAREARRLLAESYLDRGQTLCEQGDLSRGLLWMARSLETAPADAVDLQRVIRGNLGAWAPPTPRLRTVLKHAESVEVVAFSRDGKIMLTGEQVLNEMQATARLWETATGKPIGVAIPYRQGKEISLSPDGTRLATGWCQDEKLDAQLWDAATGMLLHNIPLPEGSWTRGSSECVVAFSGDGKTLFTPNGQFVEVASGKPFGRIWSDDWLRCADMSRDGKLVATGLRHLKDGQWETRVRVWDLATGEAVGQIIPWPGTSITSPGTVAISPDGKVVATGGNDGIPRLWDVATGKALGAPFASDHEPRHYPINAMAFSPDGRTLLTGHGHGYGGSWYARLWDAATGAPLGLPLPHGGEVHAVAFSPDGKSFLTGARDKTARLWDMRDRRSGEILLPPAWDLAFSSDGQLIGTGGGDKKGQARLWDRATGRPVSEELLPDQGRVTKVAFSPDGKTFATASQFLDQKRKGWIVHFWDVNTGRAVGRPLECDAESVVDGPVTTWWTVMGLAIDSDGQTLTTSEMIALTWATRRRRWHLTDGRLLGSEQQPGAATGLYFPDIVSPDGKRKLILTQPDFTALITGPGPSDRGQIQHQDAVIAGAFSADGTRFLTGSQDKTARLWDAATLRPIGPSIKHQNTVGAVAFSPDGQAFWTGSESGARLTAMPPVVEGDVERIVLWMQVLTGAKLQGMQFHGLTADEWLSSQERLEQMGGPPLPKRE